MDVDRKMTLPPKFQYQHISQYEIFQRKLTFRHMRCSSLNKEQGSLHVDREMVIKELLIDIRQNLATHDPRIQDQDVDLAECFDRLIKKALAGSHGGHICFDWHGRIGAYAVDRIGDLLSSTCVGGIVDYNGCSVGGEFSGDGGSDRPGRSSDNYNSSLDRAVQSLCRLRYERATFPARGKAVISVLCM